MVKLVAKRRVERVNARDRFCVKIVRMWILVDPFLPRKMMKWRDGDDHQKVDSFVDR